MKIRAAVLHELGRSRPYERSAPFTVEEVDLDPPGIGEVLVRIEATGLCHSDLLVVEGVRDRPLPVVIGHEASGIVEALGPDIVDLHVGDHVVTVFAGGCGACRQCRSGRPNICRDGLERRAAGSLSSGARRLRLGDRPLFHGYGMGTFAEKAVLDRQSVVEVDAAMSFETAALFGCAVMTGAGSIYHTGAVRRGESVAIVGLGSIGMCAMLAALDAGAARVAAVDLDERKLARAAAWGATITARADDPAALDAVRDHTDGGVDVAVEAAGAVVAMRTAYGLTAPGGRVVAAGLVGPGQMFSYSHADLVSSEREIRGSFMGGCDARRDLPNLIHRFQDGRLPVDRLIDGSLTLDDINHGFDRLARGEVLRQVVRPQL